MQWFNRHFIFVDFYFWIKKNKNACSLCALWGNFAALCLLALKKNVQTLLWKRQICPKFINVIMEHNWSHKYRENSRLYNVAMKGLPLSLHIFIWTSPGCFTVIKSPPTTSMCSSIYTIETGTKCEISGFMWQVAPESKTQLISCNLSPNIF